MTTQLTAGQRALLTDLLLARRQALRGQLELHQEGRSRVEHARDVLLQDGDDAPQRASDREVDLALSDMDAQEISAIDRALARAQGDNFGLCIDCNQSIPFDRLRIEPQALRCVPCESRRERP